MPGALVPVEASAPGAKSVALLAATTRGISSETGAFNSTRAKALSFQKLTVSIPPNHKTGEIEWPETLPGKAEKSFVTLSNEMLDEARFNAMVDRMIPANGQVLVFVHGYNTTHEDAVFRLAQIINDSEMKALPILFSWPSRGVVKDYLTDRESIFASRTRMLRMFTMLSRHPRVKGIDVLAHSMGTMLTMETLQMAKLAGKPDFGGKLNLLILAAPDIDVDVFMTQFEVIGRRKGQTVILVSRDDKALKLSSRLAGDVVRVGAASPSARASLAAIEKYGFTVIDLTDLSSSDSINHSKFAASPLVVRKLSLRMSDNQTVDGAVPRVGSFMIDTAGRVLEAPVNILRGATGR
ncbi:MAG: alpha/beta hydrolase [Proteobacteria bacterium]|nr:alpha/beta hydrolase [Pseudomonadota bacterium]